MTTGPTRRWSPRPTARGRCGSRWPGSPRRRARRRWWSRVSGSVALLGDALHNAADALTAVPLGVAFILGRRRPEPPVHLRLWAGRGPGRQSPSSAVIALSSAVAAFAAVQRLLHPRPVTHLAAVAIAAALGFAGNELVARYRIRTGRRIGSGVLVADGLHARTDGFTSLAVLAGAGGAAIWAGPGPTPRSGCSSRWPSSRSAGQAARDGRQAADGQRGSGADRGGRGDPARRLRGCWAPGRSGCAGSGAGSAPNARSWSTRTVLGECEAHDGRGQRGARGCSTPYPIWPPPSCMPIRWTAPTTTRCSPTTS